MDQLRVKKFGVRLRRLLFSSKSREFSVFLFFLAVSAGFWLLQTLDETFEMEIAVPLRLADVPDEVVITTPLPDKLHVTVRDKGTILMRYWHKSLDSISLSFADYDNGMINGRVRVPQADVLKSIQGLLAASTRVQAIHPDTIEFFYNHGMNAVFPVAMVGEVETNAHYYLLDVTISPSEVKVFAPASTLDTLTSVRTMPVSLTDLKETTTLEVPLRLIRGAKMEPERVTLTATVDVYMENTIEVPIVSLNFPGDKQLRTFPSSVKVTYTVGYSRSKEVTRQNFVSVVTYEELLDLQGQGATKIPVRLKSIPEGVKIVRIEPQELDYLVEEVREEE